MKNTLILYILAFIIIIFAGKNQDSPEIFYPGIVVSFILLSIALYFDKKNGKKELENSIENTEKYEKENKQNLLMYANTNNTTKAIYTIYNDENHEIHKLIKNSGCDFDFEADGEENLYALTVSNISISKKKDSFLFIITSDAESQVIVSNDETIDISTYTEEEILNKAFEILSSKIKVNELTEFEIGLPKWQLKMFLSIIVIGVIATFTLIILSIMKIINIGVALGILLLPLIFVVIAIFGLLSYYNEKLIYKDDELTYISIFKKVSKCKITDVKRLYISTTSHAARLTFVDKDDNKLIAFNDDGTIRKRDEFHQLLNKYNIKSYIK